MKKVKAFLKQVFWCDLWSIIMTISLIEVLAHSLNWYFFNGAYAKWHMLGWGILFLIVVIIRIVTRSK